MCSRGDLGRVRGRSVVSGRGFTLIEVLIAAFIVSLGVIGLAALFAGAARQQQVASQTTRSVSMSKGAEALIVPNLGSVQAAGGAANWEDGVWYYVPSDENGSVSVNPDRGNDGLYFAAQPQTQPPVLYERPPLGDGVSGQRPTSAVRIVPGSDPALVGFTQFSRSLEQPWVLPTQDLLIRVRLAEYEEVVNGVAGGFETSTLDFVVQTPRPGLANEIVLTEVGGGPNASRLVLDGQSDFDDFDATELSELDLRPAIGSLDPSSPHLGPLVRLRYDVYGSGGFGFGGGANPYRPVYEYRSGGTAPDATTGWRPVYNDPSGTGELSPVGASPFDGGLSRYQSDGTVVEFSAGSPMPFVAPTEVLVERELNLAGSLSFSPNGAIVGYARPLYVRTKYVELVEVIDYEWAADRLVSLNDRTRRGEQPGREGTTPEMAYSVLYRKFADGTAQAMVVTYGLRPGGRNAGSFVPNEDISDVNRVGADDAPLRLAELTLGFDTTRNEFYVRTDDDDTSGEFAWATEPGQLLIFRGDPGSGDPPGADDAVRVRRQLRVGDELRGYLDGSPRAGGASLLGDNRTELSGLEAFGVQASVESLDDPTTDEDEEGEQWGLTPLEARVFQVRR